jgi:NAD+ kinase
MKCALFANVNKQESIEITNEVALFLKEKECTLFAFAPLSTQVGLPEPDLKNLDCIICIGGDGTILGLFQQFPGCQIPVLGINAGHLGFLTEVPLDELHATLEEFLKGEYTIQERMMMEGTFGETSFTAINDVVIHRSSIPSLIDLSVHVDGEYLSTFCADGLIVATPGGSTAYSLSAGGPILSPELEAFVLTPICPHTISNRPIVFKPHKQIEIEYYNHQEGVEITFDGHSPHTFKPGQKLTISPSHHRFRMVKLERQNYFHTLRTKLGWSGQIRYKYF